MTTQVVNLTNFGQSGYLPDINPSLLPPTGFSYSRNWRFREGGHTSVTEGYTDALTTRSQFGSPFIWGDADTDLTFMFTWELSEDNAIMVYDQTAQRMLMCQNSANGELAEYNLSVENTFIPRLDPTNPNSVKFGFTYTSGSNPAVDEFTINASGQLVINLLSTRVTNFTENAIAGKEFMVIDNDKNKPTRDLTLSTNITFNGNTGTISFTEPLSSSFFEDGVKYFFRFATKFKHAKEAAFKWQATQALGIPIFNNTIEPPWEFDEEENIFPYIHLLTRWPNVAGTSEATCASLSSFGAVLVAVGFVDPLGDLAFRGNVRTLAFSDVIINAGGLPNWDFDKLDSEAGLLDLSLVTDGPFVGGSEVNNLFIANSTTDVIAIVDQGGGSYGGTKLELGGGILSTKSTTRIPTGFFNIGNGHFYIHDTASYQVIGSGQYVDTWFRDLNPDRLDEIQTIYDPRSRSVWIKTPVGEFDNQMWIINLENNFTLDVLDDHAEVNYIEWSADGVPAKTATWGSFADNTTWDTIRENTWQDFPVIEKGEYRNRVLSCGGRKTFVNDSGSTYNGRTIRAVLQKKYFKLGTETSYHTFEYTRVVPWVSLPTDVLGNLDIRVGGSNSVWDEVRWSNRKTYKFGRNAKLNFRKQTRWGSIEFVSTESNMDLSGVEITFNSGNRR